MHNMADSAHSVILAGVSPWCVLFCAAGFYASKIWDIMVCHNCQKTNILFHAAGL